MSLFGLFVPVKAESMRYRLTTIVGSVLRLLRIYLPLLWCEDTTVVLLTVYLVA